MAHRLQLPLVTASREVKVVHQFFDHLTNIINIVVGSSKRNDELQYAQEEQIENMIASNKIETGREANKLVLCNGLEIHIGDLIFNLFVV